MIEHFQQGLWNGRAKLLLSRKRLLNPSSQWRLGGSLALPSRKDVSN